MQIKSLTLAALAAGVAPCLSLLHSAEKTDGSTVIVVTAERRDTDLERSTSITDVITPQDAADAGHPFNTFDLFRSLPGVDVIETNGGIDGSTTSIRLRGGRGQDTRYLLDGIPINDPTAADGAVNASVIPSTGLDRIEVVKGAQSGLYGANAVGGVVNLISRRPTAEPRTEGLVEGGSFGTLRGAAGASRRPAGVGCGDRGGGDVGRRGVRRGRGVALRRRGRGGGRGHAGAGVSGGWGRRGGLGAG